MNFFYVTQMELISAFREKLTSIFMIVLPVVIVGTMALIIPEKENLVFTIGGNMALFMMFFAAISTTASLVEKRQTGTLKRIFIMPLRPTEFLAGTALAKMLQLGIMVLIMVGLMLIFGVKASGSWVSFFLVVCIFAVFAISLGIIVSVIAKSISTGVMVAMAIANPLVALSGAWMPIEMVKKAIGNFVNINPVYQALYSMNSVLLEDKTIADVKFNLTILLIYTIAAFATAVFLFNTRILENK
jgi:ABC-2 type transport system permease protein